MQKNNEQNREDAEKGGEEAAEYDTSSLNSLLADELCLVAVALEVGGIGLGRENRGSVELHVANAGDWVRHRGWWGACENLGVVRVEGAVRGVLEDARGAGVDALGVPDVLVLVGTRCEIVSCGLEK